MRGMAVVFDCVVIVVGYLRVEGELRGHLGSRHRLKLRLGPLCRDWTWLLVFLHHQSCGRNWRSLSRPYIMPSCCPLSFVMRRQHAENSGSVSCRDVRTSSCPKLVVACGGGDVFCGMASGAGKNATWSLGISPATSGNDVHVRPDPHPPCWPCLLVCRFVMKRLRRQPIYGDHLASVYLTTSDHIWPMIRPHRLPHRDATASTVGLFHECSA